MFTLDEDAINKAKKEMEEKAPAAAKKYTQEKKDTKKEMCYFFGWIRIIHETRKL